VEIILAEPHGDDGHGEGSSLRASVRTLLPRARFLAWLSFAGIRPAN
jgi:hypothetical protein